MTVAARLQKSNTMPEAKVSTQERQARLSKLLKQADQLVKEARYDDALERVRSVFELEPANMYARAYEERILVLKAAKEQNGTTVSGITQAEAGENRRAGTEIQRIADEVRKQQEEDISKRLAQEQKEDLLEQHAREASMTERKELVQQGLSALETQTLKQTQSIEQNLMEQVQHTLEEERKRVAEQTKMLVEELKASIEGNKHASVDSDAIIERVRRELEADLSKTKDQMRIQFIAKSAMERRSIQTEVLERIRQERQRSEEEFLRHMEEEREAILRREQQKSKDRALEAYKSQVVLLTQFRVSEQVQDGLLRSLRIPLGISDEEHASIARLVQVNAYVEAVREAWKKGRVSREEAELLNNLGNLYHIPPEQKAEISEKIKQELGVPTESRTILVLDDEDYILEFLKAILEQTYETILTAKNVEEAVQLMSRNKPSLIVCDVNLSSPEISGFTFCERLKEGSYGESLKDTPFVIMSGVADDFFIKAARQLGSKAYLPKPFTREKLETVVRSALA